MEKEIMELAKTRPDMACIFQVLEKKYPRFTVYRTYIACYGLNQITSYCTTDIRDDIIPLSANDRDLNKKIAEAGYNPEDNVIFSFFIENQPCSL